MLKTYLILFIIVLVFFAIRKFIKTPPEVVASTLKKTTVLLLILVLVFLAASGRLNWIAPLIGVLVAFALRALPWIARYIPQLHRLWFIFKRNKNQSSSRNNTPKTGTMTAKQAYEILGLDASTSKQQIIARHRQLIQKLHPDRDGSDYLAAQINQAKDVLLETLA